LPLRSLRDLAAMTFWISMCGPCRSAPEEAEASEAPLAGVQVDDAPGVTPPVVKPVVRFDLRGPDRVPMQPTCGTPELDGGRAPLAEAAAPAKPEEEVRICPVSGLSTLEGVCPFAKPTGKAKPADSAEAEAKPAKLKLRLDFQWEEGGSKVNIEVRPHLTEHFATLGLPDTASKEEIRRQYRKLALLHHPDKHPEDVDGAQLRFQQVEEAYQALKDTDGEMAFRWDEHPEQQQVMTGEEAVRTFGKIGMEACDKHHLYAIQLRHMVRSSATVKVLIRKHEEDPSNACQVVNPTSFYQPLHRKVECWVDGLCSDPRSGADHVVRVYRRDTVEEACS